MHTPSLRITLLDQSHSQDIAKLVIHSNATKSLEELTNMHQQMFGFNSYHCFGLYVEQKLIGVCGAWTTIRPYSGKQLELDHLVISPEIQSKGYGSVLLSNIEDWAKKQDFKTIELNTYVANAKSHKFYFNLGYEIIGFHFQKKIEETSTLNTKYQGC